METQISQTARLVWQASVLLLPANTVVFADWYAVLMRYSTT